MAQVLEERAAGHQSAGRLVEALSLRLLALQLLHVTLQAAKAGLSLAASTAGVGSQHSGTEGGGAHMQCSMQSVDTGSSAGRVPGSAASVPHTAGNESNSATGAESRVPSVTVSCAAAVAQVERLAARQRVVAGRAEKVRYRVCKNYNICVCLDSECSAVSSKGTAI